MKICSPLIAISPFNRKSPVQWGLCKGRNFLFLFAFVLAVIRPASSPAAAIKYGSGDFVLNEGVVLHSAGSTGSGTLGGSGSITLAGVLSPGYSGGGFLLPGAELGAGSLTLAGSGSTYSGSITIGAGILTLTGSGTLTVSSSGSIFTIYPGLSLAGSTDPAPATRIISLYASSLTWENLAIGETESRTLTIYNWGNSPLQVTGITYPSGFSGDWVGLIPPYSGQTVSVTFTPPSAGTFAGNIVVNSDATSGANTAHITANADYAWPIRAFSVFDSTQTGTEERLYWKGSQVQMRAAEVGGFAFKFWIEDQKIISKSPTLPLSVQQPRNLVAYYEKGKSSLDSGRDKQFGKQRRFTTSERFITLTNTGNVPVYITGLRIIPLQPGKEHVFYGDCWGLILPGAKQDIPIYFYPTTTRPYGSRIIVQTSLPAAGDLSVEVTGTGK